MGRLKVFHSLLPRADTSECPGRLQRRYKIAKRIPHGRQANASLPFLRQRLRPD
jgi:hypothetical protein